MNEARADANILIDEIDEGLIVQKQSVAWSLLNLIDPSDAELRALITAFATGAHIDTVQWAERIWARIDALPYEQQGALRLGVCLFHPDGVLDWHDAGYFIGWAHQEGLSDEDIIWAFHALPPPRLQH